MISRPVLFLLALAASCQKPGPMREYHAEISRGLKVAAVDEYALKCAPRELALAQSHQAFAELEWKEGDSRRAEEHLLLAKENVALAVAKADACRPRDRDKDGVTDEKDKCPDEAEDINNFEDDDGCPEHDRDRDGIKDANDACPDQPEDKDGYMDADGCPDPDNDNDGIVDVKDACPDKAEDRNGYQDEDGCPEGVVDRDGDGFRDDMDKCPDEPENKNEYLDDDGCPDVPPSNVRITQKQIQILEKINFETGKARILPNSYGILDSVAQVLRDYPNIKVRVEGHTDSQGSDAINLKLSQARSESVRAYLINKGVDPGRLEAQGLGETKPLDTNNTNAGRAVNRRVEFTILSGM
jgi:outer membrane protein OmpA-like peptidoglycan-associated protein